MSPLHTDGYMSSWFLKANLSLCLGRRLGDYLVELNWYCICLGFEVKPMKDPTFVYVNNFAQKMFLCPIPQHDIHVRG